MAGAARRRRVEAGGLTGMSRKSSRPVGTNHQAAGERRKPKGYRGTDRLIRQRPGDGERGGGPR